MKQTLLELVQDVLSAMSSDEVNSISDTEEAEQVARVAKEVYFDLSEVRDWGHSDEIIQLTASGDSAQPTRMKLPDLVRKVGTVRYDDGDNFYKVIYKSPEDFLEMSLKRSGNNTMSFDSGSEEPSTGDTVAGATSTASAKIVSVSLTSGTWAGGDAAGTFTIKDISGTWQDNENINISGGTSNVATVDGTVTLNEIADDVQDLSYRILTDRDPTYWTSFDDTYLWFDSYDSSVESTLQASKTLVTVSKTKSFTTSDTYEVDIPDKDYAMYKNMVKALAFEEIKQMQHATALGNARRFLIRSQKENGQRTDGQHEVADYGRRGKW